MSRLLVEFIEGSKKKTFDLEVSSQKLIESGGIPQQNTFNLILDDEFLDFWNYVVDEFGVSIFTEISNFEKLKEPNKAVITQKIRSIDSNLPWIHKLEVSDEKTTESIIFIPFECTLVEKRK
jgi:hypothetical protein